MIRKISKDNAKRWAMLIIGAFLMAVAYKTIYGAAGMVTGGFSGIAIIVRKITSGYIEGGIPLWITNTVLNIPLFAAAYKTMGRKFIRHTIAGTFFLTLFMAVLPSAGLGEADYFLASAAGGAVCGAGIGLVLLSGATTGGTDMLASLIHTHVKHYTVVKIMQVIDAAIVAFGIAVYGIYSGLYSIISIYIITLVSDSLIEGRKNARAVWVISDDYIKISKYILENVKRGLTRIDVTGVYSDKKRSMLLCVVSKKQVPVLQQKILEIDKQAFIIVGDVREVMGEGFVQNL